LKKWSQQGVLKWLRQFDPNASRARNVGALAASGEVILFLDDDIRISSDYLASYASAFARTGAAGVSGPILEGNGQMIDRLDRQAFESNLGWLLHFPKNYSRECRTSFMMSGNVGIRRDLFLSLGGMDENYQRGAHREESDFAMRFRKAGYRFHYDPKCHLYHLGPSVVPGGGARNWQNGHRFGYFHHCVGDWYFNLKFCTFRTTCPLFATSLRHFVFNHQTLERPWRILPALTYWLAGMFPAFIRRLRGAKLVAISGAASGIPNSFVDRL